MKDIQQLIKKDNQEGRYKDIFPESYTEAIRDKESGEFLDVILSRVNFLFLPYTVNSAQTRLLVPSSMRRKALWLAYVKVDGTVVIEYYNSDDITDEAWQKDNNWVNPLGIDITKYITASISGTYAEGQVLYDSSLKKMKLYNGTEWVNLDGTALAEANAIEEVPASQDTTY